MIRRKDLFIQHLESHGATVPCTACDKVFVAQENLEKHMEVVHGNGALAKVWDCPYCIETFLDKEKFTEHQEFHKVDLNLPLTGWK